MSIKAIIFDFDGVLVESVDVKTRAFARMFEDKGEDIVQMVTDYHLKNGGLSRVHKFKYYYKEILKCPLSEEKLGELCNIFSRLVIDDVINSPYVRGAKEFLERFHCEIDLYIASGTPEEELREIVRCRGMDMYFKGIYGSPAQKGQIARVVLEQNGYNVYEVIFIGDSITDLNGAQESGVGFIGRVADNGESNSFEGMGVKIINDMNDLEEVIVRFNNCNIV
ncbi:MAG: HAD family hydrolase [Candidatus Brocadiales bacterium]|nr:HAD family hydrolase [Candidatus Brocadiales bacterium]